MTFFGFIQKDKDKDKDKDKLYLIEFFSKWFFISVILILVGIIIIRYVPEKCKYIELLNIVSELLKSVGLAIFVSNIFTFIIGTDQFMNYIKKRLVDVIISKDFITKLSISEQHELLHLTLRPSKDLSSIYSRINDYFNNYINESLNLFKNSYRGHLTINAVASYDEDSHKIKIESEFDFIIYRVNEKFENINIYFEDECSRLITTRISAPKEKTIELKTEDAKTPDDVEGRGAKQGFSHVIPDSYNDRQYISVYRKIVEYGDDHWQLFNFKTIQPYDGMIITLRCEKGVCIRKNSVYGRQDDFSIVPFENGIRIKHHDWVVPGFGASVTVAKASHGHCDACQCSDCKPSVNHDKL